MSKVNQRTGQVKQRNTTFFWVVTETLIQTQFSFLKFRTLVLISQDAQNPIPGIILWMKFGKWLGTFQAREIELSGMPLGGSWIHS
jgi:hypothetical protein